ncbi:MAG: GNAT family N-acetyltransferase [Pseudomonadota bacterium]
MYTVRRMKAEEADTLGALMFDAIHHGVSHYTSAQRMAWLHVSPRGQQWATRLAAQDVWVGVGEDDLLGFVTLDSAGYIDLAYVGAAAQGRGVFAQIYAVVERTARARALPRLRTHASLMAQPAFAAQGFHVTQHETVERAGQYLERAEMEKHLT